MQSALWTALSPSTTFHSERASSLLVKDHHAKLDNATPASLLIFSPLKHHEETRTKSAMLPKSQHRAPAPCGHRNSFKTCVG